MTTQSRAIAALEDYLIQHGMNGSYADKVACVEAVSRALASNTATDKDDE